MQKAVSVSPGIGIGRAYIVVDEKLELVENLIDIADVDLEIKRFDEAIRLFIELTGEQASLLSENEADILFGHIAISSDPEIKAAVESYIKDRLINVEIALNNAFEDLISVFSDMQDDLLRERAADLKDIRKKILAILLGVTLSDYSNLPEGSILVARELTPSVTASISAARISGIVTENGGYSAHASIIARSLEIPSVVCKDVLSLINPGDLLVVDGINGGLLINPSADELEIQERNKQKFAESRKKLEAYRLVPSVTKNGKKIDLFANIGGELDAQKALANDAEGVGLFRTEFLYMDNDRVPTEDEQFSVYKRIAALLGVRPLIIRTLDVGGDKDVPYLGLSKEENPNLGFRAIRFSLAHEYLFLSQFRAILRASAYGNIWIMIPLVIDIDEFRAAKVLLENAKAELTIRNETFDAKIKIGMMIETPAAALLADELAKEADFFSIGTNDLTQYTLAVDRGNENVAQLYSSYHPAVLKLIKNTVEAAKKQNIVVGMCGEAASDPMLVPFLVWLGIDELSVGTSAVLKTRSIINSIDTGTLDATMKTLLGLGSTKEVTKFLEENFGAM